MRPWDTAGMNRLSHTAWWHLQDRHACEKVCPYMAGVQIGMPMLHMGAPGHDRYMNRHGYAARQQPWYTAGVDRCIEASV